MLPTFLAVPYVGFPVFCLSAVAGFPGDVGVPAVPGDPVAEFRDPLRELKAA